MVSARILRHIARGIYRSPAGALKELISNAYDAGASKVTINTGYPLSENIIVTDDGKGMTGEQFISIVQNIGLSGKSVGTPFKTSKGVTRETIGHYGIGLLAVGQICRKLIVRSKTKNSTQGFIAELDFEQFELKTVNKLERAVIIDEKIIEKNDKEDDEKFSIGTCKIWEEVYSNKNRKTSFTKLDLTQIRTAVQKKLAGHVEIAVEGEKIGKSDYFADYQQLLTIYSAKERELTQGQYPYEKLLWELGMYCPVEYPDIHIFKSGELSYFQELARKNDFTVIVDGLKIYKPYLKDFFESKEFPIKKIFKWQNEKYTSNGKKHKISAFLVLRQRIRPKSLQGVLVRQSGIAIGKYDLTYLSYPFHQGPKFEQLTGEIYADGLSGALNIDRDSFNETDDNYLAMSLWFHKKLSRVFKEISSLQKTTNRENAETKFRDTLNKLIKREFPSKKLKILKNGKDNPLFEITKKLISVNKDNPNGKLKKDSYLELLLASYMLLKNVVSPDEMEEIISEINNIVKD